MIQCSTFDHIMTMFSTNIWPNPILAWIFLKVTIALSITTFIVKLLNIENCYSHMYHMKVLYFLSHKRYSTSKVNNNLSLTHSHTHSLSLTHTHTLSLSLPLSHTHTLYARLFQHFEGYNIAFHLDFHTHTYHTKHACF